MNDSGTSSPRFARVLAFVLAAWLAFAFAFTPLRSSHDEWWHLKSGQYIAEHGLPKNEIFTYTAADFPWHNHEWTTQIAMWKIWQAGEATGFGGVRALILFKTLFIIFAFAGFGMLAGRGLYGRGYDPIWAALATALCVALARRTFYPRPPFVTYLLMAVVLWLFCEVRAGSLRRGILWLLLPLFALWANLHGGWMAGLLIIGAYWADAALTVLLTWKLKTDVRGAMHWLITLSLLGIGCALAVAINPYGYHLYELAGRVYSDRYLLDAIGEMMPPDWHFVRVLEVVILIFVIGAIRPVRLLQWIITIIACVATHFALAHVPSPTWQVALAVPFAAIAIARIPAPGSVAHILLVCFFLQQGIMHVRHLSLLGIVALPSLAWILSGWAKAQSTAGEETSYGVIDETESLSAPDDEASASYSSTSPSRFRRCIWKICLGILLISTFAWIFAGPERPTYWQRNMQLAGGQELATGVADFRDPHLWAPSQLPRGMFAVEDYPVHPVDFLIRAGLPAPLFNGGNYAGYLMWRLSPEKMKVFTDNRYDIYGGIVIREQDSVMHGWTHDDLKRIRANNPSIGNFDLAWDEVLDKWNVQTVFIPKDASGNAKMASGGWEMVYEDYSFNIWVRDTPANHVIIQRALALDRPLPFEARFLP